MALTKARSLLIVLVATCEQTLLVLDAAGESVKSDIAEDIRWMVARVQSDLQELDEKLTDLRPEA